MKKFTSLPFTTQKIPLVVKTSVRVQFELSVNLKFWWSCLSEYMYLLYRFVANVHNHVYNFILKMKIKCGSKKTANLTRWKTYSKKWTIFGLPVKPWKISMMLFLDSKFEKVLNYCFCYFYHVISILTLGVKLDRTAKW